MIPFGVTRDGQEVHKITLSASDLTVSLLTWGAVVQDVRLRGVDRSLTLGSDHLRDYEGAMRHHGSLIGPIANRISTARVRIDGMMYELERNQDGRIHLHSGAQATHLQVWEVVETTQDVATFRLRLPDGMCGPPGNREIIATFRVLAPATLTMTLTGTTDAKTCMNFANHSYWNLDGTERYDGHRLRINADHYLPSTPDDYPTGDIVDVTGTLMDFRQARMVALNDPPFDNNFCLSGARSDLRDVLELTGQTGVSMKVATTEPGIQVYDARDAYRPGRGAYEGLAIEAQGWPDAPTNPHFPSILITPDAPYHQVTSWMFNFRDMSKS
ncbi:MAG: aldose epimerase family protein [Pseudomonadota bacterium]